MTSLAPLAPHARPTRDEHLRQARHISATWCDDELVLLDANGGRYYTLNHAGGRIWELLASPRSVDDIAARLRVEYDVPPALRGASLERDVTRLVQALSEADLVVVDGHATDGVAARTGPD